MVDPSPEVVRAILARRSIRFGYTSRPVERPVVEQILSAGLAAPSSKNAQPWRLHLVSDRARIGCLADAIATSTRRETWVPHDPHTGRPHPQYVSTVLESAEALREAPVTIWIENLGAFSGGQARLLAASGDALAGALEGYGLEMIGIGAAVENMWLAANALGLAAAFMGDVTVAESAVRAELGLLGDLVGVLVLGYSDAAPVPPMDAPAMADSARIVWH